MNGIARFVLSGGLIVATAQLIAGPLADWNARRDAAVVSAWIGPLGVSGRAGKRRAHDGRIRRGFAFRVQELKRLTQNVKTEGH